MSILFSRPKISAARDDDESLPKLEDGRNLAEMYEH